MKEKCVISILLDGTTSVQTSSLWIRGRSCSVALWLSVVISFLFSSVVNGFYNLQHSQFCLTTCLRIQRMNNNNRGKKSALSPTNVSVKFLLLATTQQQTTTTTTTNQHNCNWKQSSDDASEKCHCFVQVSWKTGSMQTYTGLSATQRQHLIFKRKAFG